MYDYTIPRQPDMKPGTSRFLTRREVSHFYQQGLHVNRGENWSIVFNDDGQYLLQYATKKETSSWTLAMEPK